MSVFINRRYIRYVGDYQPYLLSRPQRKSVDFEKSETLEELGIITVTVGLWSSSL